MAIRKIFKADNPTQMDELIETKKERGWIQCSEVKQDVTTRKRWGYSQSRGRPVFGGMDFNDRCAVLMELPGKKD